jgi:fructose-1,6-bisphosphatase II / sedoheptulose-1,7-bisphosphatase
LICVVKIKELRMSSGQVRSSLPLDRILSLEIARVTERAAVAAAKLRGRGNEKAADQAAVDAMPREMNKPADSVKIG